MNRRWYRLAWRPVPFALALGYLLRARGVPVDPAAADRSAALARALSARGLDVAAPSDVTWVEGLDARGHWPGGSRPALAVVRAAPRDEPPALYSVEATLSPENVLLDAGAAHKLTKSSGVEERPPVVDQTHLASAVVAAGNTLSVQLLDLAGEPRPDGASWTPLARLQNALTNLQDTGRASGVGRRSFRLVPPATDVSLAFEHGFLVVRADGREARVPEVLPPGVSDAECPWLVAESNEKGQVGNLTTWAVDRVRAMEWFGDENMQRLKAVAFGAYDWFARATRHAGGDDNGSAEIATDLGLNPSDAPAAPVFTDPETGWPPAPVKPFFEKPLPGEGEWILLKSDPFVRVNPGAPPAFATTFVRTDRERPYTHIYITIWDPRQVELHPVAGTVEPVDATGSAGPGVIPRTPRTMKRLVAAFNGGFQALHGEFGMMADGVVYLPPKPYSATVATLRDGSTAFGVWPASTDIPNDVVSYRQNLTPLVQDEKYNPYNRTWWGGTPPDWTDRVHTTRSGLCLTRENFVAFFFGDGIAADVLGQAMIQARCKLAMHLDMNPGHTGLEFYHAEPAAAWKPLGRPYQSDWEAEGDVGTMDWKFRARRMVRGMGLMNFPRYIHREARDFFYLALRPVLPGADLAATGGEAGEGAWRVNGLPQQGFPYAVATTFVRAGGGRARVMKLDPRALTMKAPAKADTPPIVVLQNATRSHAGDAALYLTASGFGIGTTPAAGAAFVVGGALAVAGRAPPADAAALACVDDDGMLLYFEHDPGAQGSIASSGVDRVAAAGGCTTMLWLGRALHPLLGGTTALSGAPTRPDSAAAAGEVRLFRGQAPGGRGIFADTPIVPVKEWQPLQMKRIRYFHPPKDEAKPAGAPTTND